jgi:hypothetical protein
MIRRVQACVLLLLVAMWLPAAGGSWAYCLRTGELHPATADCCIAAGCGHGDHTTGCHDDCEPGRTGRPPCCVDAGKLVPDAVAPDAERSGSPSPTWSPPNPAAGQPVPDPTTRAAAGIREPPHLPPPGRRYLMLRTLRL